MYRTRPILIGFLLSIAGATMAEEKPAASPAVPPLFRKVFSIDQQPARLILSNRTVRFIPEKVAATPGQTILKPVYEERVHDILLDSAQVAEVSGKKLSREEIMKRVGVGDIVVVSADGGPIDPAYLKTLQKNTLVIISPIFALQVNSLAVANDDWSRRPYGPPLRPSREPQPKP